jgi:hypothetical protein
VPITTSSTPAGRNLGHQWVRKVRTRRAILRLAGFPAGGGQAKRPRYRRHYWPVIVSLPRRAGSWAVTPRFCSAGWEPGQPRRVADFSRTETSPTRRWRRRPRRP